MFRNCHFRLFLDYLDGEQLELLLRLIQNVGRQMNNNPLAALAGSMDLLKKILETTQDVYWVIDKTGRFVYVSPSVVQQRGYTPEEVMNMPALDSIHESDRQTAQQTFTLGLEMIDKGLTRLPAGKVRLRQTHKNGSFVWTEVVSEFFFNEEREFMFVLGVSRNINELVAAEQQLKA
jgi:PAS domain S-box-containing protein